MKTQRIGFGVLLFGLLLSTAHAGGGGMLRISCEGDAEGAAVTINGKFKGDCPMDVAVPAGTLNVRVVKAVDNEREREFTQTVRMGDDVVKTIDVSLGESKISAAAVAQRQKQADQRYAAEAKRSVEQRNQKIAALKAQGVIQSDTFRDCPTCPDMVVIPAGEFMMGSPSEEDGRDSDEKQHQISMVYPFSVGKYEVTQGQWRAVMGNNPSNFNRCGDSCPVEQVSWDDVQIFIQKLNAQTGKTYRLPSEAEWEYACRAGTSSVYCGGNNVDAVAWQAKNSNDTTHPVGKKQPNAFGIYDMSGNVWEWVADCNADYDHTPSNGSALTTTSCDSRVRRGGSWYYDPRDSRAAYRNNYDPSWRFNHLGFRLARTLP